MPTEREHDRRFDGPWPTASTPDREAFVPAWEVQQEHADDPRARYIGHAEALLQGSVLTPAQLDELAGFLRYTSWADVVLDYDPADGFAFRPRDPHIDGAVAVVRRAGVA